MLFSRNSAKYILDEYIWVIPQDYFAEESNYLINHWVFFFILSSCEIFFPPHSFRFLFFFFLSFHFRLHPQWHKLTRALKDRVPAVQACHL